MEGGRVRGTDRRKGQGRLIMGGEEEGHCGRDALRGEGLGEGKKGEERKLWVCRRGDAE